MSDLNLDKFEDRPATSEVFAAATDRREQANFAELALKAHAPPSWT